MNWTRLEQKETYLMHKIGRFNRKKLDTALYNGNLLILGDGQTDKNSEKERLCCWNIRIYSFIIQFIILNRQEFLVNFRHSEERI